MRARLLQKRRLCTLNQQRQQRRCRQRPINQVTKSNFAESLQSLKTHIASAEYIAVSTRKTGSFAAPWRRILPFLDTAETAYLKSKDAAERFQILQFAVCPFTVSESKVVAHPYNFHLFPRDELNVGMPPSYSFSCQTSYLTYMAREGFDFNSCIYDGISYLSRVQETSAKNRLGKPLGGIYPMKSSSTHSVADSLFLERIRARVQNWMNVCKDKKDIEVPEDSLVRSLRKLISFLGVELHGSRPCMNIDVCNERQVQLALEMLSKFSSDLVPLVIPGKSGEPQAVRVVLTSSEEDKNLLERELQDAEDEETRKIRGFREVIDAISSSQKPIVAFDCLHEFTFIHSKFVAPLPHSMNEFMCSLLMVFPHILDVNHLLKEISPLKKASNIPAAFAHLRRRFSIPIDMEIPHQAPDGESDNHGHHVLLTVNLFAKLSSILKTTHAALTDFPVNDVESLESYMNIFTPSSAGLPEQPKEENVWISNTAKVSTEDLVFIWGFRQGMLAEQLKSCLSGTHNVFSEDFDVRLADKSCAILVFWKPGLAKILLDAMDSGSVGCDSLRELVSEGLKATGYEAYKRVCSLGLWETDLADSFDRSLTEQLQECNKDADCGKKAMEVYWSSDSINLDEL
ncbi:hypothetical protein Sjap_009505 [Stephania japonica]|uniref:Uncharacterized protein n=1 Tax=Stephania japonica TaxID=461633 RepID=A0AAP0PFI0_9MAGN